MSILDPLYSAVAHAVVGIHSGIEPLFGKTNGYGWALSIVLLTLGVRLVLFPLFVKQIKSQRTMQMLQPKMKEIREKYKNDRAKMNAELMALQKEHGNPLLGCLPIFAQIPLFIALFRVLNSIAPKTVHGVLQFQASHGLTQTQAQTIGTAKIFGVPLAAAFRSSEAVLHKLTATSTGAVKGVALVLIVVMCTTTFLTQKQIQGRNGPVDPSQRAQQRMLLYLAPGMLAISGFIFPVGVLVYWLTTNLWSMGQQFFVLRRLPTVAPALTTGAARSAALATGGRGDRVSPAAAPVPASAAGRLRSTRRNRPTDAAPDHPAPRTRLQQSRMSSTATAEAAETSTGAAPSISTGVGSVRGAANRPAPGKARKPKNRRGGRR